MENYPDLKANQNVLSLQEQLTTTENQIGFARQHYNATVLDYNSAIATFPSVLIAGPFGFSKREFFDAEAEAQAVPTVNLGFPPQGSAVPPLRRAPRPCRPATRPCRRARPTAPPSA